MDPRDRSLHEDLEEQEQVTGLRIALVQMLVSGQKAADLKKAEKLVGEAAKNGAKLITLPEYFTCLMDPKFIIEARERIPGQTSECMSDLAKKHGIYLAAGSIPEIVDGTDKLYNTCSIFNPQGKIIAQHRKMHLFDVNLGPHLEITESAVNLHGKQYTVFDTGVCKVGIGICLDLRYPEFSRIYCQKGAKLLLFTGAFSARKTGPAHWEVLQRARAIDNQTYVAAVSPAVDETQPYVPYGHSSICDPWGEVIAKAGTDEEIVYGDIGPNFRGIKIINEFVRIRGLLTQTLHSSYLYSRLFCFMDKTVQENQENVYPTRICAFTVYEFLGTFNLYFHRKKLKSLRTPQRSLTTTTTPTPTTTSS